MFKQWRSAKIGLGIFYLVLSSVTNNLAFGCQSSGNDWLQFRGSAATSTTDSELPVTWTSDQNCKWRLKLPGRGWSSPVHADGIAWMTSAIERAASPEEIEEKLKGLQFSRIKTAAASVEFHALAVDLESGKLLHDIVLGRSDDPQPINPMNSFASPTPVVSDGKVVCHFGAYGTWCLDANTGEKLWQTRYVIDHSVGPGSSPIVVDSKVILACDGCDQQFVAAVRLEDGEEVWKTSRPPIRDTNGEFRKGYCTPVVCSIDGSQQIVVTGSQWICSYAPDSGKEIWRLDYGRGYSMTGQPFMIQDMIVFPTGYDNHEFVAFTPEGTGELAANEIRWRKRGAPSMSSSVISGSRIFSVGDRGILSIIDPVDGSVIKRQRTIGNISSSPLVADGKMYIGSRDGLMAVVTCDDDLEVLHEYDFGSPIYASPCPIGNDLLVRTAEELIRITATD